MAVADRTVGTGSGRDGLRCRRCDGLMLPERLYDETLGLGPMECWGWRCLVCGELIDPLILERRRGPAATPRRQELFSQAGPQLHHHKLGGPS